MSNRTLNLTDELYNYLLHTSVRETPAQVALRELTSQHKRAQMQIAPDQAQFMALLVKLLGVRQFLEIGTFTGYSALTVAQALPEDGSVTCCDISQEWTDIGKPFWKQAGVESRIDLRLAPALETLDELIAGGRSRQFDMAFIDADKENYDAYYERCLVLVRSNGLILFDNTLWSGRVADPGCQDVDTLALKALNKALNDDERVDIAMLSIGDGLTLARVK